MSDPGHSHTFSTVSQWFFTIISQKEWGTDGRILLQRCVEHLKGLNEEQFVFPLDSCLYATASGGEIGQKKEDKRDAKIFHKSKMNRHTAVQTEEPL